MNLELKIIKAAEGSDLLDKVIEVDMNGLSIGRADNNDLVLKNDASISKQHAVIQYQHGDFYVYDTSTNGVFLSNDLQALNTKENNFQLLKDQDSVRIGSYILQASLGEQATEDETHLEVDLESLMIKNSRGAALLAEEQSEDDMADDLLYDSNSGKTQSFKNNQEEFDLDRFLRGETFDKAEEGDSKIDLQESSDLLEEMDLESNGFIDAAEQLDAAESVKQKKPLLEEPVLRTQAKPSKPNTSYLVDLLFEELGLSEYKMDAAKQLEVVQQLVVLIKTTLQCMHDSVQKRQESLQNLGLTSISYKKTGNNPILFSANLNEALNKLLFPPKASAYLTTEEAIPQCFADLENYQYYLATAAKETLQQTLDQFSPQAVAKLLCDVEVKRGFFNRKTLINFNNYTSYYEQINAQSNGQLGRIMQKNVQALPNELDRKETDSKT